MPCSENWGIRLGCRRGRWLGALGAVMVLGVGVCAAETNAPPTVVYRWDSAAWLTKYNAAQFEAAAIKNADGSDGARIVVTKRSSQNPYNHIIVTSANLKGGQDYTAAVTFTVVEATKFPQNFYMFARNSAGNQHDIWTNWIGLPGETRTITLPLHLAQIEGGKWTLSVGIGKSGGLDVHSIVVYSGTTSDGKTGMKRVPPTDGPAAVSAGLPQGVVAATGAKDFAVAPPAAAKKEISLADYGFKAEADGNDAKVIGKANAAALQKAIKDCRGGPAKLTIPSGLYRVNTAAALVMEGLTDVTIDGQGATLMFDALSKDGPAMIVMDCARLAFTNIQFDWDNNAIPIASLGTVSALSADKKECEMTFADLSPEQVARTAKTPWKTFMSMDPGTLYRADLNHFNAPKNLKITAGSKPNALHVAFPTASQLKEGQTYAIRHLYYEMSAFKMGRSSDVSFRNVTIYSMPGMGWFFSGGMQNLELVDCHIKRPAGRRDPLTTAADGIHVDQYIRNVRVENCTITGCGDDAMNIHSEAYQGEIVADAADNTKLKLMHCPSYLLRLNPGDPVEFYNSDFSPLGGQATPEVRVVAEAKSDNAGKPQTTTIWFTKPLPPGVTEQSILINGRYETSNLIIRGCRMTYTNGRGILVSSKNVTIENNVWDHVYGSAINLESDIMPPLWSEGRGVANAVIRNNTFDGINMAMRYNGAMIYTNNRMPYAQTTTMLCDQITIENNRFVRPVGPIVSLSNVKNLLVRGNQIQWTDAAVGPFAGTLFLEQTRGAALGGNTWLGAPVGAGGVMCDPATTSELMTTGNGRK